MFKKIGLGVVGSLFLLTGGEVVAQSVSPEIRRECKEEQQKVSSDKQQEVYQNCVSAWQEADAQPQPEETSSVNSQGKEEDQVPKNTNVESLPMFSSSFSNPGEEERGKTEDVSHETHEEHQSGNASLQQKGQENVGVSNELEHSVDASIRRECSQEKAKVGAEEKQRVFQNCLSAWQQADKQPQPEIDSAENPQQEEEHQVSKEMETMPVSSANLQEEAGAPDSSHEEETEHSSDSEPAEDDKGDNPFTKGSRLPRMDAGEFDRTRLWGQFESLPKNNSYSVQVEHLFPNGWTVQLEQAGAFGSFSEKNENGETTAEGTYNESRSEIAVGKRFQSGDGDTRGMISIFGRMNNHTDEGTWYDPKWDSSGTWKNESSQTQAGVRVYAEHDASKALTLRGGAEATVIGPSAHDVFAGANLHPGEKDEFRPEVDVEGGHNDDGFYGRGEANALLPLTEDGDLSALAGIYGQTYGDGQSTDAGFQGGFRLSSEDFYGELKVRHNTFSNRNGGEGLGFSVGIGTSF